MAAPDEIVSPQAGIEISPASLLRTVIKPRPSHAALRLRGKRHGSSGFICAIDGIRQMLRANLIDFHPPAGGP